MRFVIHVSPSGAQCRFADIVEADELRWCGELFHPLGCANFYEYLRDSDARLVGIEMHLSSDRYDHLLSQLPGFERAEDMPTVARRWKFWFHRTDATIAWEQILSQNPYLSKSGNVLLVLETSHLNEQELVQLTVMASRGAAMF